MEKEIKELIEQLSDKRDQSLELVELFRSDSGKSHEHGKAVGLDIAIQSLENLLLKK